MTPDQRWDSEPGPTHEALAPGSIPPGETGDPRKQRSWLRRLGGIALIAGGVAVGAVVSEVVFGLDAYERYLVEAAESLMKTAEFEARYGTVSADEAEAIGFELGAKGVGHLTDADLSEYFAITVEIVELMEPEPCAGLLAGSVDSGVVLEAAKQLELETFKQYVDSIMAGARAELAGAEPTPSLGESALQGAFIAVADELGRDRAREVFSIVSQPDTHSAEEACSATVDLLGAILRTPDPERRDLLRFMASEAARGL